MAQTSGRSYFFPENPSNLSAKNCKLSSFRGFFQNLASSSSFCVMSSSYVEVEKNHSVQRAGNGMKRAMVRAFSQVTVEKVKHDSISESSHLDQSSRGWSYKVSPREARMSNYGKCQVPPKLLSGKFQVHRETAN